MTLTHIFSPSLSLPLRPSRVSSPPPPSSSPSPSPSLPPFSSVSQTPPPSRSRHFSFSASPTPSPTPTPSSPSPSPSPSLYRRFSNDTSSSNQPLSFSPSPSADKFDLEIPSEEREKERERDRAKEAEVEVDHTLRSLYQTLSSVESNRNLVTNCDEIVKKVRYSIVSRKRELQEHDPSVTFTTEEEEWYREMMTNKEISETGTPKKKKASFLPIRSSPMKRPRLFKY